uniref:Uncharacterized protein n=1 Tax=Eutreptiella gymnastica TaxID=73025 RepID=A0A7S4LGE0_9EUGL|mmetsp:Transcript_39162/g.63692  ORF Transcript_39162/g.63692 Transcript_39162/m.63692 type:complete len:102 (+) Transcript_39162:969-1274(+)
MPPPHWGSLKEGLTQRLLKHTTYVLLPKKITIQTAVVVGHRLKVVNRNSHRQQQLHVNREQMGALGQHRLHRPIVDDPVGKRSMFGGSVLAREALSDGDWT